MKTNWSTEEEFTKTLSELLTDLQITSSDLTCVWVWLW